MTSIIDPLIEKYSKDERVQNALIAQYGVNETETREETTKRILEEILVFPERAIQIRVEEYEKKQIIDQAEAKRKAEVDAALADYEVTKRPIDTIVEVSASEEVVK